MSEGILMGMMSGGVTLLVCLINNWFSQKKSREENAANIALIEYKLNELTEKVSDHNNLVERMYCMERKFAVHEEAAAGVFHTVELLDEEAHRGRG